MTASKRPAFAVAICCGAIAFLGAVAMLCMKMLCAGQMLVVKPSFTFAACVAIVGDSVDRYTYALFLAGAVLVSLALLIGDWRRDTGTDRS